ncbi:hypothetical protein ACHAQJ_003440 [Trichoderma viride]
MDPLLRTIKLDEDQSYYYPGDKFGLDPNELFTTLHDRYNTNKFPILDANSFHRDVYECADDAETLDQFYSKLEQRKAQRIKELVEAWDEISLWLSTNPKNTFYQPCYNKETGEVKLKPDSLNDNVEQRSMAFIRFTRTLSFDSMVMFFDGFARDEREKHAERRRRRKERQEILKKERAAKRLAAASRAIEATAPDLANSHGTASSEPKSTRDASTLKIPCSDAATISDKARSTSPSRRRDLDQLKALTPARTTRSSTRRKSTSDENGYESKKRRVTSDGAGGRPAEMPATGQYKRRAAPSSKKVEKRKMMDEFQDGTRKKRSRRIGDPIPSSTQRLELAAEFVRDITPPAGTRASSPVSTDDSLSFTTAPLSPKGDPRAIVTNANAEPLQSKQASPQRDGDGLAANISTISADTRELNRILQPRGQRVDKRRSRGEQKSPPPKKPSRQRRLQEQNALRSVQQTLRSSRSSRRGSAQELWFLGDDGTTRVVVSKERN